MLTISDNDATDALLHRVGIDTVNDTCARLGPTGTVVTRLTKAPHRALDRARGRVPRLGFEARERAAQKLTPEEEGRTSSAG